MSLNDVFIYDALRTPRAKGRPARGERPGGALADTPPHRLVTTLIDAIEGQHKGVSNHIGRLALGCVGQIGPQGGHIALVSRLASQLSNDVSVRTLNNYCVSGLSAIFDAALWSMKGSDQLALAGGVESLSQVGFLEDKASYYSDPEMIQSLKWAPPVMGAELIATIEGYAKEEIDALTYRSHQRAHAAWENRFYKRSVVPVYDANGEILIDRDALIRPELTPEKLSAMRPAFARQGAEGFDDMMLAEHPELTEINHIHSIANCPGMADGASLLLVGNAAAGENAGLTPRARIIDFTETADDPVMQLTAGMKAMNKVLERQGLKPGEIDRYEFMEAFAAVPLKFERDYDVDPSKVNVNGGHLAMGHPMGATGAILATSLLCELEASGTKTGMAVAQAGGGIGAAILIERI